MSIKHPRLVAWITLGVTLLIALAAALPSVLPEALPFLKPIQVDTDPENMLSADSYVRVFHHEVKERFSLSDFIVLGIVNDGWCHPELPHRVIANVFHRHFSRRCPFPGL